MAHEPPYPRSIQTARTIDEGTQTAVAAVVDVADDEQGVHPLGDAKVYDVLVGIESSRVQRFGLISRRGCPDSRGRAVQAEISGANKTQGHIWGHPQIQLGGLEKLKILEVKDLSIAMVLSACWVCKGRR